MDKNQIIKSIRLFREKQSLKYKIKKIGVFGSVARNNINEQSDIDVVVELETANFITLISIKQELESQLHHKVDIVRYREKMNKFLKDRIDDEAIYV